MGKREWRFLIDGNLPPRLGDFFRAHGYGATHLKDLGMERAPDVEIWKRAYREGAVIVTKDKDFASLTISRVDVSPVILVRLGNVRQGVLLAKFEDAMQDLVHALNNGDMLIELT